MSDRQSDRILTVVPLVSGGGRTVLNFLDRIEAGDLPARIPLVLADRDCAAIERIGARGVPIEVERWIKGEAPEAYAGRVWPRIEAAGADLVCLSGFLRLLRIPPRWEGRVFNIHPGLLPEFGGKGMYGERVHRAVLASGAGESGCTVHVVDNVYDHGPVILRKRVPVRPDDDVDSLAARVFRAECEAYPEAIRLCATGRLSIQDGKVSIQ